MNVSISVEKNGLTAEQISISEEEELAIKNAYEVVSERCGADYVQQEKDRLYWCFLGALRIGGIAGLERYAKEAKTYKKKRTISAGYCGSIEDDPDKRISSP